MQHLVTSGRDGYWLLDGGDAERVGSHPVRLSERESLIRKKHKNNGMLLMVMCVFVCAMVARFNIADEPKIYYLIHIEREFVCELGAGFSMRCC